MGLLLHAKALHIIAVVTWFAGLFYIVRLFVYSTEAQDRPEAERVVLQEQFKLMERRLWYGITWPSMVVTLATGLWLLFGFGYLGQPWMWVKLGFVVGLVGYHASCHWIFLQLQRDQLRYTPMQLRIWNEVATLFLVAITSLVVLKSALDFAWSLVGLLALMAALMAGISAYKGLRLKNHPPAHRLQGERQEPDEPDDLHEANPPPAQGT